MKFTHSLLVAIFFFFSFYNVSFASVTINSVTINPNLVVANSINQYTITITGSDSAGASNILGMDTLINYWSYPDANRGDLYWASGQLGWPAPISCVGGGMAGVGWMTGIASPFVNVISCSTSTYANTRTANIVVTFNPNFTWPTNNTFYGYATNWNFESTGFVPSGTFSLVSAAPPTASITSPAVDITILENQSQQFTGSATGIYGSTVVGYEWRINNCATGAILSSLASFVKSFSVGTYTVYLRAKDNAGLWSTNCPSRTVWVIPNNQIPGVCGSANGVPTQKKPKSNLCNTVGLPGPVVLPVGITVLPESNPSTSWSWTCYGENGASNATCSAGTSCGDNKCQPSKGENPSTCKADCKMKFFEF